MGARTARQRASGSPAAAPSGAMPKKDAYLLTSPGFAGQLALNLLLMGALAAACVTVQPLFELGQALHDFVTEQMMHAAHRMAWWSLLGLLSSSCCALQIMLNAFSFGCTKETVVGSLAFVTQLDEIRLLVYHSFRDTLTETC